MDALYLDVAARSVLGKNFSNLRRAGTTPLHLIGRGKPSLALQCDTSTVSRVLAQVGRHMPFYVQGEGTDQELVFVREVQRHPITNRLLHVDLLRVDVSQAVRADIPVTLVGESPAVRTLGGELSQTVYTLSVEALPMEMPDHLEVDVSTITALDQALRVSDLTTPSGVTIVSDPDEMVARVSSPRGPAAVEAEAGEPAVGTTADSDDEQEGGN